MGLADIASVPLSDTELSKWSFLHQQQHADIARRLYETLNVNISQYVLDPLNPDDTAAWQYQHQLMHNDQNALLNINGQDLLGVDWKDEKNLRAWLWLHLPEHRQANLALGL